MISTLSLAHCLLLKKGFLPLQYCLISACALYVKAIPYRYISHINCFDRSLTSTSLPSLKAIIVGALLLFILEYQSTDMVKHENPRPMGSKLFLLSLILSVIGV